MSGNINKFFTNLFFLLLGGGDGDLPKSDNKIKF